MDFKKSISAAMCGAIIAGISLLSVSSAASAADTKYKISMKRANPAEPISRDGILSAVKSKYKGRILSVQEKPSPSTPDCHIVRMLSLDGEYMTIQVACGN
ncbi:MAG: hypothetical protein KJ914_10345 [Gammaproteobacteria bacterium]|nr:hypothetical protein [Gammaproteobacteria bacterium]MBU1724414.1 hypothetical protein [Gammaproteobacteria bacterium]MBU2004367.1 hypothetical protein [Gammaproteobacteria bacterium]